MQNAGTAETREIAEGRKEYTFWEIDLRTSEPLRIKDTE
jgi:hypothetical protein